MLGYNENEKKIAEGGFDGIKKVLCGDDVTKSRRLLFCLDRYLDPIYQIKLDYEKDIFELLQEIVISSDNDEIIDDCLQLLGDYATEPLTILENGIENIKSNMRSQARYVLNMQTESFI